MRRWPLLKNALFTRLPALSLLASAVLLVPHAQADEGMWTFDNFPFAQVNSAYNLKLDQAWLDRVRLGSVRLTSGCSASLVSPQGLVLTNHHCVVDCVQNFSEPGKNRVELGFYTKAREEERRCPGMAAEILLTIDDVTGRINDATAGADSDAYIKARDAEVAAIESECQGDADDKRCEVVSFYQGGQYKVYEYHRYADLRLVFAPEFNAAFFGGDPDNFNFPRYAYDSAFLRLYENDAPVATPDHLQWRSSPLQAGEPVFVSGNPGSTSRLYTTAQMAFVRDHFLPWRLATLSELRGHLLNYSAQGPEQARMASDTLFGVENSFKAFTGERNALVDPAVFDKQAAAEAELQKQVAADPALKAEVGTAWDDIAAAEARYRGQFLAHQYIEQRAGNGSELFYYARALVRAAAEREKPEGDRLPEFADARLKGLEQDLFADAPAQPPLEELLLSFWLSKTREYLTVDDPRVVLLLGKENPEALAKRLVEGTTLGDPAERRRLYEGGQDAIAASTDPMIQFARRFDEEARRLRREYEEDISGPLNLAQEKIAKARFKVLGDSVYPDATFTLRLSYGSVQGWIEPSGREVEPFTRMAGLYQRATGSFPFALTQRWLDAQSKLDPDTIFDVSTNNDIIGGNSGSPLLDKDGNVVGAIFDGNIHSLGGDYVFDATMNRAVAVATTAIEEGLEKVYPMQHIADELNGKD
ncbi:MAG: S46 family peptidase [Pseudomonadota bacterium]